VSSDDTINREARAQAKGFRLQKLRAVELMLNAMETTERPYVYCYCAIENEGDVNLRENGKDDYIEEDKNYDSETAFSLNSHQVLNTMVIFIDAWHKQYLSSKLFFGFYSTTGIAKERQRSGHESKIAYPKEPVLQLLINKNYDADNLIDCIKIIIIEEYTTQYTSRGSKGNLETIKAWRDTDWIAFLERISWSFDMQDEGALEKELVAKIKKSKFYSQDLDGKEAHLISLMIDLFDQRQLAEDPIDRFVHASDIMCVVKDIQRNDYHLIDPVWELWNQLPLPSDKRNIIDKYRAVCKLPDKTFEESLCRKVAINRHEQKSFSYERSILSFKYRVYDTCIDRLKILITSNAINPVTNEIIEQWVTDLVLTAQQDLTELSKDYKYLLNNDKFLRGVILELIDSCFLSFDQGGNQ
jgi:hypothetical protein